MGSTLFPGAATVVREAAEAVERGDWLTSIDLKDAYLHVPMHPEFQKYLRFSFDGVCYQFRVLPFGITTAPRVITQLMLIRVQVARSQGRCCHPYLDDWLLRALAAHLSRDATFAVMCILTRLGWIINLKKSVVPTQDLVFLGARVDTARGLVSLSLDQISKDPSARVWLQLLGTWRRR
ncbi:uncharacterized protein [Haliotis asinina]|uniref:uncharacterized protein n=1 Tax=Haliotis asinina TaxID=109174 RepID=UPI00353218CF